MISRSRSTLRRHFAFEKDGFVAVTGAISGRKRLFGRRRQMKASAVFDGC